MYVMTPFTSLLVLENDAMYTQFKVDRGRKDHWAMYDCPPKIPVVYEPLPGMPAEASNLPKGQKPNVQQVVQTVSGRFDQTGNRFVVSSGRPRERNKTLVNEVRNLLKPLPSGGVAGEMFGVGANSKAGLPPIPAYGGYPGVVDETRTGSLMFGVGLNSNAGLSGTMLVRGLRDVDPIPNETGTARLMFENPDLGSDSGLPSGHYLQHRPKYFPPGKPSLDYDIPTTEYEWERIWYTDQPSHLTPERTHGGIQGQPSRAVWMAEVDIDHYRRIGLTPQLECTPGMAVAPGAQNCLLYRAPPSTLATKSFSISSPTPPVWRRAPPTSTLSSKRKRRCPKSGRARLTTRPGG